VDHCKIGARSARSLDSDPPPPDRGTEDEPADREHQYEANSDARREPGSDRCGDERRSEQCQDDRHGSQTAVENPDDTDDGERRTSRDAIPPGSEISREWKRLQRVETDEMSNTATARGESTRLSP
jgi:hypothetical protein